MLYTTKRELLEGLIVAELIARPGQGPLARRHFPAAGRGPASGVRSTRERTKTGLVARAGSPAGATPGTNELLPPLARSAPNDEEDS